MRFSLGVGALALASGAPTHRALCGAWCGVGRLGETPRRAPESSSSLRPPPRASPRDTGTTHAGSPGTTPTQVSQGQAQHTPHRSPRGARNLPLVAFVKGRGVLCFSTHTLLLLQSSMIILCLRAAAAVCVGGGAVWVGCARGVRGCGVCVGGALRCGTHTANDTTPNAPTHTPTPPPGDDTHGTPSHTHNHAPEAGQWLSEDGALFRGPSGLGSSIIITFVTEPPSPMHQPPS